MKTTKFYSIGLIATIIFTLSQQSFAQLVNFYGSSGWVNTIAQIQESQIIKNALGKNKSKSNANSGSSKSTSSSTSSSQSDGYIIPAYRRYPAVQFKSSGTRLTVQEYLDKVNVSPQEKAEMKIMVLEYLKLFEEQNAAKEYPNDLALAFVSYIGLMSHVYQGKTEKPIIPLEQNLGLRDVVAEHFTNNGVLDKLTNREKQEIYEILVYSAGLTYYLYRIALSEKNAEAIKFRRLEAANGLKLAGIKL